MADEALSPLAEKNKKVLPWYDRGIIEGMVQFGPARDGFTVFVTPQAVKDLRDGTHTKRPDEAFGLLMGRVYEDQKGCFTVVSGAVYARRLSATPGHVKLTADEMGELRREASRIHPTVEFVGWTHSHGPYIPYSRIDLQEQKTWSGSHNIGILTFMYNDHKGPWAVAYRGPDSEPLALIDTTPYFKGLGKSSPPSSPSPQAQDSTEMEQVPQESVKQVPQNDQETKVRVQERSLNNFKLFPSLLTLLLGWPLILALILGFMLFNLNRSFTNLESRIAGLLPVHPSPVSTNLLWNCDRQTGKAPLAVKCNGPVGPSIQGWVWDFGDGSPSSKSNTVTHTYQHPGQFTITLTIIFSSGNQRAGSLDVKVDPPPTPTVQPT